MCIPPGKILGTPLSLAFENFKKDPIWTSLFMCWNHYYSTNLCWSGYFLTMNTVPNFYPS
jgi:hypothetical protein